MGETVNLVLISFRGSNPLLPNILCSIYVENNWVEGIRGEARQRDKRSVGLRAEWPTEYPVRHRTLADE